MQNNPKTLAIFLGASILLTVGAVFALSKSFQPQQAVKPITQEVLLETGIIDQKEATQSADMGENVSSESAKRKVKVVEFSDFQCSACAAAQPGVEELIAQYPEQIEVVYRHFPLSFHQHARAAALVSEAAREQDKFKEMTSLLFDKQTEWSETADTTQIFEQYANELGLNLEQFRSDLNRKDLAERIDQDLVAGSKVGVQATPTFFINGQKVEGLSLEFETILNQALESMAE